LLCHSDDATSLLSDESALKDIRPKSALKDIRPNKKSPLT
jgi:hypothetical protein